MGEIKVPQSLITVGQCDSAYKASLGRIGPSGAAARQVSKPSFCAPLLLSVPPLPVCGAAPWKLGSPLWNPV